MDFLQKANYIRFWKNIQVQNSIRVEEIQLKQNDLIDVLNGQRKFTVKIIRNMTIKI